jgi:hypothetical protein
MHTAYLFTKYLHAGLGVAALLSFWIAALAKKGSRPHKLAGKAYVLVMVGLLLPAIPLSWRTFQHFSVVFGLFLFYLLLITGNALYRAWTAVRRKRDFAAYADANFRRLGWANIAAGAAILGVGAATTQPVLLGFSAVGILGGRSMLALAANGPGETKWWLREHMTAMLGCGVATHIAFLLIGLPRVLPPAWNGPMLQTFGWLAPLAVAAIAGRVLGRKFLGGPRPRVGLGAPAPSARAQSPVTISPVSTLRDMGAASEPQAWMPSK